MALASMSEPAYRAVVAIDFGTTNSGAAYAFTAEKTPRVWPLQFSGVADVKVPTSVVVEKRPPHRAVGFGPSVMDQFDEEEHAIFHRFKMQLYDNPGRAMLRSDVGGLELPAVTVIARCLEVLKDRTLVQMKEQQGIELQVAKVLWVLTVPAIWPEASKQLMRRAAHMAGLIESEVSARLVLALEPECAAIQCQETLDFLKKDVRYAVLDCGGGTVDTTVYVVKTAPPQLDLQELHRAGGGGWGSTRIDAKFVEFLRELLGEHHECLQDNSFALFELLTNVWEERKVRFGREQLDNPAGAVSINISAILEHLPSVSLRSSVETYNKRHAETPLRVVGSSNLKIPVSLMRSFYEDVLGHIRRHVDELLTTVKNVRYLLLVGGFAASALVQDVVKEEAERRGAELIIPPRPWLSIVLGAVQFGLRPKTISLRRARLTYGTRTSHTFVEGEDPENRKEWDERLGEYRVRHVFRAFVKVNDPLPLDHEESRISYPLYDDQDHVSIRVVACDREVVSYTDEPGVLKLGRVTVDVPSDGRAKNKAVKCTMQFGLTEITVMVESLRNGNPKRVAIQYTS